MSIKRQREITGKMLAAESLDEIQKLHCELWRDRFKPDPLIRAGHVFLVSVFLLGVAVVATHAILNILR